MIDFRFGRFIRRASNSFQFYLLVFVGDKAHQVQTRPAAACEAQFVWLTLRLNEEGKSRSALGWVSQQPCQPSTTHHLGGICLLAPIAVKENVIETNTVN